MEKYRTDKIISTEELKVAKVDVEKEMEKQGKCELAHALLSSLENMEFGKVYAVAFEKKKELDYKTGGSRLVFTAHFCEFREQER